jgi:hypothetical protein
MEKALKLNEKIPINSDKPKSGKEVKYGIL